MLKALHMIHNILLNCCLLARIDSLIHLHSALPDDLLLVPDVIARV